MNPAHGFALPFRADTADARVRILIAAAILSTAAAAVSTRAAGSVARSPYAAKASLLSARSILDAHTRAALERALTVALKKLASTECQRVLLDFRDGARRTLQERISAGGRSAGELFDEISFRDGSGSRTCSESAVIAWTRPGASVVYLCSSQFARAAFLNGEFTANVLIHEGLHCLGLGENPPSAGVITATVAARCRMPLSPPAPCPADAECGGGELRTTAPEGRQ